MNLVMLVDSSSSEFEDLVDAVDDYHPTHFINTEHCDETHEYKYLLNSIEYFSQSSKNSVLLAKFSGKETIAKELGDELSEMILTVSYNKKSNFYTECPTDTIKNLVDIFGKKSNGRSN